MRYLCCILLILGFVGCNDGGKLASVDGRTISADEFDAYLKIKHIDSKDDKRREALFKQYIEREALAVAIEKADLLDKQLVQAEFNEIRRGILINRYFEQYLKTQLSDEAVQKYYEDHSKEFSEDQVHAAHILFRTNSMMTQEQRQGLLGKANEVYDQIKGGQSFAELAGKYSQDKATAANGGDLGWIKKEAMGKQFSDAAFALQAEEVSKPVETSFGYHLIKALEPPRSIQKSFSTVSGLIKHKMKAEVQTKERERLLSSVKTKIGK